MAVFARGAMTFVRLKNFSFDAPYIFISLKIRKDIASFYLVSFIFTIFTYCVKPCRLSVLFIFNFFYFSVMQITIKVNVPFMCQYLALVNLSHTYVSHGNEILFLWKPEQSSEYFFPS